MRAAAGDRPKSRPPVCAIVSAWKMRGSLFITKLGERFVLLLSGERDVACLVKELLAVGEDPLDEGQCQAGRLALGRQVLEARWRGRVSAIGDGLHGLGFGLIVLAGVRLAVGIDVERRNGHASYRLVRGAVEHAIQIAVADAEGILADGV